MQEPRNFFIDVAIAASLRCINLPSAASPNERKSKTAHGNDPDTEHRANRRRERHRRGDRFVFSAQARGLELSKRSARFIRRRRPSFHVSPQRQTFHCFGCGAGGSVFRFVMDYEHLDFPAAVQKLAARAGIPVIEERGCGQGTMIGSTSRGGRFCNCTPRRRNGFTRIC